MTASLHDVRDILTHSEYHASLQGLVLSKRVCWKRFEAPKRVVFGELPKTTTGKIEKYKLRQTAREL